MKRFIIVALAASTLSAGVAAAEALPEAVADIEQAFGPHLVEYSDPWDTPPGEKPNGFDIDRVRVEADAGDGTLRVGISMADGAIAGDSDGDGNPHVGSVGPDSARLGLGEAVQIDLDLDGDRIADFFVRIDRNVNRDDCALFRAEEADGLAIGRCSIPPIGDTESGDLVIDIADFAALREAWLADDARDMSFDMRVIVDSDLDDRPADIAPDRGYMPVCPFGGATEKCDGFDQDCDGLIDEDTLGPCDMPSEEPVQAADGEVAPEMPRIACDASPGEAPAPTSLLLLGLGLLGLRRRAR